MIGIAVVFFFIISFLLFYGAAKFYETAINKKIVGIADNISTRSIQKRSFFSRGMPMRSVQVLSFRIVIPGEKPVNIPSVYEYSGLNLMKGDIVQTSLAFP